MRKAIIPLAALAISLASCDTGVKDSYQTSSFVEYNLIVDTQDSEQPAHASLGKYEVKINYSKDQIDVKGSDIIINNQKYTFETDPTSMNLSSFSTADGIRVDKLSFAPANSSSSSASDVKAEYVFWKVPSTSNPLNPNFELAYITHLDISYIISGRYRIQSFTSNALYTGNSTVVENNSSFSSKKPSYAVIIDFEKNIATVYIYNPEYSVEMPENYPKEMCLTEVPVKFTHDSYRLESAAPKTTILSKNDKNDDVLVESDDFKATDFTLAITSPDLTEAVITYKLGGRQYSFSGCAVLKPGK